MDQYEYVEWSNKLKDAESRAKTWKEKALKLISLADYHKANAEAFEKINEDEVINRLSNPRRHAGDCSIYASLRNISMPEAGICTCGFGYHVTRNRPGDYSEMYSQELSDKITVPINIKKALKFWRAALKGEYGELLTSMAKMSGDDMTLEEAINVWESVLLKKTKRTNPSFIKSIKAFGKTIHCKRDDKLSDAFIKAGLCSSKGDFKRSKASLKVNEHPVEKDCKLKKVPSVITLCWKAILSRGKNKVVLAEIE